MEVVTIFTILGLYCIQGVLCTIPSKRTFTKHAYLNKFLFPSYQIFTHTVGDYKDCLVLCSTDINCLSVVHYIDSDGKDSCIGYEVVFPDEPIGSIIQSSATYYTINKRECLSPFVQNNSSDFCVRLVNDISPVQLFQHAEYVCNYLGGWLAKIDTAEKLKFVEGYLSTTGVQSNGYDPNLGYYFGGYEIGEELWVYPDTINTFMTAINPLNWKSGEPVHNNSNNWRCIVMMGNSPYYWLESDCDVARHFLCEMPAY